MSTGVTLDLVEGDIWRASSSLDDVGDMDMMKSLLHCPYCWVKHAYSQRNHPQLQPRSSGLTMTVYQPWYTSATLVPKVIIFYLAATGQSKRTVAVRNPSAGGVRQPRCRTAPRFKPRSLWYGLYESVILPPSMHYKQYGTKRTSQGICLLPQAVLSIDPCREF